MNLERLSVRAVVFLVAAIACAPVSPGSDLELQILSKGAPTVIVAIDGIERMRVTCNGTGGIRPGGRFPAPPFDLRISRQDDGRVLLDTRVSQLPRWVLVTRESASVSDAPISGPVVACE
jgi:hypothetical protein